MPEETMITIPVSEFKELLAIYIRLSIFEEYVNKTNYISKEDCIQYLGFEVSKHDD